MRVLTVMSRGWCHLCTDLLAELQPLAAELGWQVEVFDVDADPQLEARWDEQVPVVLVGDELICFGHLDAAAVRARCVAGDPVLFMRALKVTHFRQLDYPLTVFGLEGTIFGSVFTLSA